MAQHSKRYLELTKRVDRSRYYTVEQAVTLLLDLANAKFDESLEVAIRLNVNPSKGEENVRGTVVLPH